MKATIILIGLNGPLKICSFFKGQKDLEAMKNSQQIVREMRTINFNKHIHPPLKDAKTFYRKEA